MGCRCLTASNLPVRKRHLVRGFTGSGPLMAYAYTSPASETTCPERETVLQGRANKLQSPMAYGSDSRPIRTWGLRGLGP